MPAKYQVARTLQLRYLAIKKNVTGYWTYEQIWTLLLTYLSQGCLGSAWFFGNFRNPFQLWGAVSPSSMNIFLWDRYRWKDLCISFKTSLIRAKTDPWRQSYSRYKIRNFRKSAFTAPTLCDLCVYFHAFQFHCFETWFRQCCLDLLPMGFILLGYYFCQG